MKKLTIILSVLFITIPSFALDLQQAREQKILTEQPDGFVKVVKPSAEADELAKQVNAARKAEYERISKENGQPVDVVGKVAAQEIARKLGK